VRPLSALFGSFLVSMLAVVAPAHSATLLTLEITGVGTGSFTSPNSSFTSQPFDFHLVGFDGPTATMDLTIANVTIGGSTVDFTSPMRVFMSHTPNYISFGYQGGADLFRLEFSAADFLLLDTANSFFGPATVTNNLFTDVPTSGGLLSFTDFSDVHLSVNSTPLPAALPLFAGGLGVIGFLAGRRKRKNAAALAAA
jgi:hypothetical protein